MADRPSKKYTTASKKSNKRRTKAPETYTVERIVDKKYKDGQIFYLIKWLNYTEEDNTWEPFENCAGALALIQEFENKLLILEQENIRPEDTSCPLDKIVSPEHRLRSRRVKPEPSQIVPNPRIRDSSNFKDKLKTFSEEEVVIYGVEKTDRGLNVGIAAKNDCNVVVFDSKEVTDLWPQLYISYLESHIRFEEKEM